MLEFENEKIVNVEIQSEMKKSFIEYAMSVIVSRALPDVRDGLKPVHRRILYTMFEENLTSDKPFHKSAATVGSVLGKYHPHGDASVYDALVRLAQDFSLRYPLVEGHGNFGSIDGDPPAAYRYTEARLAKISGEMIKEIDRDTVDFVPNFDDKRKEPSVLPARIPCLLVNGAVGIAVGMATNIPTHNMGEVLDGAIAYLDNNDITTEELMEHVKGPDFPTGGIIVGRAGIRDAYNTGRGKVIVRAKTEIVEVKDGKFQIVITEIPFMVNKSTLVSTIAECHRDKRIEGIADMRDLSGRDGIKIVIDLKKDCVPQVVLNQLFKFTQLQDTCAVNMLALVDNQPKLLTLKSAIRHYVEFQEEIVTRRTAFDKKKALARAHILEGLLIAIDNIDRVIHVIRTSYDDAKVRLMEEFTLTEIQAQEILNMRLGRLQGLEKEKLEAELASLRADIALYTEILENKEKLVSVVREELSALREKYGDPRLTEISADYANIEDEDLIEREDCVITRTHFGYIKRLPVDTYRAQRRGGRGITGLTTREEDYVEELFVANTHSYILFFTDKGKVYKIKGYQIPEAGRTAKGTNLANLLAIEPGEKVSAVIFIDSFDKEGAFVTMATKKGTIKRTALSEYDTARKGGLIAILLDDDDEVVSVRVTDGQQRVMLATRQGKAIRFEEKDVRPMGRPAHGVRGILLADGDEVITMEIADDEAKLVVLTENGFGKRTEFGEYKIQARGGKGVLSYNLTDKTGLVAGMRVCREDDDIIAIADNGVIIRMAANEMPVYGRVTQGVKVMKLDGEAKVVTFAVSPHEEITEEE